MLRRVALIRTSYKSHTAQHPRRRYTSLPLCSFTCILCKILYKNCVLWRTVSIRSSYYYPWFCSKATRSGPCHTGWVPGTGITFVPNFMKITNSQVRKEGYVPTGNISIHICLKERTLKANNKCESRQGWWLEPVTHCQYAKEYVRLSECLKCMWEMCCGDQRLMELVLSFPVACFGSDGVKHLGFLCHVLFLWCDTLLHASNNAAGHHRID
jgi:hypothetical protein